MSKRNARLLPQLSLVMGLAVLAEKNLLAYLRRSGDETAIATYVWSVVTQENGYEAAAQRKPRLRMRLRFMGCTPEEIDEWLRPYERPSEEATVSPATG